MTDTISITGMGLLCAIGDDTPSVLDSLKRGRSGIGRMKYLKSVHDDIPVGEIKLSNSEMKRMLGLREDLPVSRTSLAGALAVREALSQAGIRNTEGLRVALISGTTVGVMDVTEEYFERMKSDPSLQYLPHSNECGTSTLEIARYAGIPSARCCTISTACSSALNAIMVGADMLRNDEADVVIAGGSEPLSRYHLNGFNSLMILDRRRCRPFDASRAGLNLGEGAGFVVLQKNASAPLAHIAGYANRCDAFHQTATSPDGEGAFLAMTGALKSAGLSPKDIDYINAHGTATVDNDASESAAFTRVFGTDVPPMSSTKSYTGHATSAAGIVETIICVLAMRNRFIPASLGWEQPFPGGVIPTAGLSDVTLNYVMCNSFGFGGNDSSLILSLQKPLDSAGLQNSEGRSAGTSGGGPSAMCGGERSSGIRIAAGRTVSDDSDLVRLKEYLPPMETRRMGKIMKASLLSACEALKEAGLSSPDAIVTATSRGMLELSTQFLEDISANHEEQLKPTLFMQSTHNTVGSAIAIRTGCHGYNITYSQGDDSLLWAERDAKRLLERGEARSVLVCSFDEQLQDGRTCEFKAASTIYTV